METSFNMEYTSAKDVKYSIKMTQGGSVEITRLSDKYVILFAKSGWTLDQAEKFLDM